MTASGTESGAFAFPVVPEAAPERCGLVGEHPLMLEAFRLLALAAPTLAPVLIVGEPGTEREAVARCLHLHSPVADGPWLAIDCGALTERELDTRLFGEEAASGAGPVTTRRGLLDRSRGGTLFLDDVTALPRGIQSRLLRTLQASRGDRRRHGDAHDSELRLVTGAVRELRDALLSHAFREDLFLRLSVVTLRLPRLADRGHDLLLLVAHYAAAAREREDGRRPVTGIARDAYRMLASYPWPGNLRELRAVVEHAVRATRGGELRLADFPADFREAALGRPRIPPRLLPSLSELESQHIALVLRETHGVIHRAAEILGIHRNTLARKMRQYRIPVSGDPTR